MSKQVIVNNGQIMGNNGQALSLQNLQPENIRAGVNIGGVTGTLLVPMRVEKTITENNITRVTIEDVPFTVNSFIVYGLGAPSNNSGYYALTHGQKDATYNFCFSHEISNHKSLQRWCRCWS